MQSHQNSSWSWRNNLKLKGTFLPFIQRNYKVIKKLSFWHSPWEKLGLILSEVVDYNLRMNFGIPDSTVVDDCLHGDKLVLPYTSSVILRLLWSEISMNFKVSGDNPISWKEKVHSIKHVYNMLQSDKRNFAWSSRLWNISSLAKENFLLLKVTENALNKKG